MDALGIMLWGYLMWSVWGPRSFGQHLAKIAAGFRSALND